MTRSDGKEIYTRISYWLIPSAKDLTPLQSLIDELADETNGPRFLAHLTVYNGPFFSEDSEEAILRAAASSGAIELTASGLRVSSLYTQTLVIDFESSEVLEALSSNLRAASHLESEYVLKPHLSLMYGKQELSELELIKERLMGKIPETVRFDRLSVVPAAGRTSSKSDVESWRSSFELNL